MKKDKYEWMRDELEDIINNWDQDTKDDDVFDLPIYRLPEFLENETSFKLYRYMPPEYYSIRNIETQKIHLSNNGVMNDIFEGIPCGEYIFTTNDLSLLSDTAKMCCFTESPDNLLMWSHYARSSTGFCVEYDIKKLLGDSFNLLNHLFPVLYSQTRLFHRDMETYISSLKELEIAYRNDEDYSGENLLDDILPLFLVKGKQWEYEQEWRIVFTKKQLFDLNDKTLLSGTVPFKCLSAVYLGYRVMPEMKKNILEIARRLSSTGQKIDVFQAKLNKECYAIEFEKENY